MKENVSNLLLSVFTADELVNMRRSVHATFVTIIEILPEPIQIKDVEKMTNLPNKTPIETMADPIMLYDVIDKWYEEAIAANTKPGSELWVTMFLSELLDDIRTRWSVVTGFPEQLFPWKDSFIALLATKKRKEPGKPISRLLIRKSQCTPLLP